MKESRSRAYPALTCGQASSRTDSSSLTTRLNRLSYADVRRNRTSRIRVAS